MANGKMTIEEALDLTSRVNRARVAYMEAFKRLGGAIIIATEECPDDEVLAALLMMAHDIWQEARAEADGLPKRNGRSVRF